MLPGNEGLSSGQSTPLTSPKLPLTPTSGTESQEDDELVAYDTIESMEVVQNDLPGTRRAREASKDLQRVSASRFRKHMGGKESNLTNLFRTTLSLDYRSSGFKEWLMLACLAGTLMAAGAAVFYIFFLHLPEPMLAAQSTFCVAPDQPAVEATDLRSLVTTLQAEIAELKLQLQDKANETQERSQSQSGALPFMAQKSQDGDDLMTGQLLHELGGYNSTIVGIAISSDKKWLASISSDKVLHVWNTSSGHLVFTGGHERDVQSIAISLDNQIVACGCDDGTVQLWSLLTYEPQHRLRGEDKHGVLSLAFSHDFLASTGKYIQLWDFQTGKSVRTLSTSSYTSVIFTPQTSAVAFSSNFTLLAAGVNNEVAVWDVYNGTLKLAFQAHSKKVRALAVSPNDKLMASASLDRTIRLWTLDGRFVRSVKSAPLETCALWFSRDSQFLTFAGNDGQCRVCKVTTGEVVLETGCNSSGYSAASEDWSLLTIPSQDCTVKLYGFAAIEAPTLEKDGANEGMVQHVNEMQPQSMFHQGFAVNEVPTPDKDGADDGMERHVNELQLQPMPHQTSEKAPTSSLHVGHESPEVQAGTHWIHVSFWTMLAGIAAVLWVLWLAVVLYKCC